MTVILRAHGELTEYFGGKPVGISLPEPATFGDLLDRIGARWGASLPAHLWDARQGVLRGPVVAITEKRPAQDPSMPLHDGQEIDLIKAMVGG
jgi:hypothetical protein